MILPGFPVMIGGQGGFGQIPIGGILLWESTTPPAGGWELYYTPAMNNRALRGVGPNTPEGATGGQNQYTITGTTDSAGAHGAGSSVFWAYGDPENQSFPGTPGWRFNGTSSVGTHFHAISHTTTHTPRTLRTTLIRKIAAPGLVPVGASTLHGRPVGAPGYEVVLDYVGRVLQGVNSALSVVGAAYPTSVTISTQTAGDHYHGSPATGPATGFGRPSYYNILAGSHAHTIQATANIALRSVGLAQMRAYEVSAVYPGMVIGYDGVGALPSGWRDANGSAGTVDMRDHYPILAELAQAGQVLGTGAVSWTASSVAVAGSHSHRGGQHPGGNVPSYDAVHSDAQGGHTHTIPVRGGTVDAAWYGIRFIQYLP